MSALSQASQVIERTVARPVRRPHVPSAGAALAALVLAAVDAHLLVAHRLSFALLFAALPLAFFLFGRTRAVFLGILLPTIVATLVFGHAFAQIKAGPIYILDAIVLAVVVLAAPAIVEAVGKFVGISAILSLFVLITALHVYEAGATRVVLRQSVIGVYALWAIVGIAVARSGVLERYVKVIYWAAAASMLVLLGGSLHDVAHDLYLGYGLLLALFTPSVLARRHLAYPIVIAELALIALGEVRSIWVALPLAIGVTMVVCGKARLVFGQVFRLVVVGLLLFAVAVAVRPSLIASFGAQANSIFNYSGTTRSDNNAKWRLSNWRYGTSQIEKHPLTGIGFGGPEVPPSVCTTGCNDLTQNTDPTVLAGSDLHNSILAIPLRLGLPAFLLFVLFEGAIIRRARRIGSISGTMQWLLACHLLTAFTALTAVVLEGPYMGIFFWLFGGLVLGFTPSEHAHVRGDAESVGELGAPESAPSGV